MGVGVAYAHAVELVFVDHRHDFMVCGDDDLLLYGQEAERVRAIAQAAQRKFANDGRVTKQHIVFDRLDQARISLAEVVDPDPGIG